VWVGIGLGSGRRDSGLNVPFAVPQFRAHCDGHPAGDCYEQALVSL